MKEDARTVLAATQEEKRQQAVRLREKGHSYSEIADYNVDPRQPLAGLIRRRNLLPVTMLIRQALKRRQRIGPYWYLGHDSPLSKVAYALPPKECIIKFDDIWTIEDISTPHGILVQLTQHGKDRGLADANELPRTPCGKAALVGRNSVDHLKPSGQRTICGMKQDTRGDQSLAITTRAFVKLARRVPKAVRPAHLRQVLKADFPVSNWRGQSKKLICGACIGESCFEFNTIIAAPKAQYLSLL